MEKYLIGVSMEDFMGAEKEQKVFKFENGYGASVVKGFGVYGNSEYPYELGLIQFDEDGSFHLRYDHGYDDVVGYLTWEDVEVHLNTIKAINID